MKKFRFFLDRKQFILAGGLLVGQYSVSAQDAAAVARAGMPSTVTISMEDSNRNPLSLGSGFVCDMGRVVTNYHVIEGARHGYVLVSGSEVKHRIEGYVQADKENDLAILAVPSLTIAPLKLSTSQSVPEIGTRVYAIGSPSGLAGTISEGIVSGIRTTGSTQMIQITAPISPGSSGGPVLDSQGNVIGVARGTITSGQNLNFAIPSAFVQKLRVAQSTEVTPLEVGTTSKTTAPGKSIDIKEGIEVIDFAYEETDFYTYTEKKLTSFALRNNTDYFVYDIKLILILLDGAGRPIDYHELTYLENARVGDDPRYWLTQEYIKPRLARTVDLSRVAQDAFIFEDKRVFKMTKPNEKIIIRVLDFRVDQ